MGEDRNGSPGATSAARRVIVGIEFGGLAEPPVRWVARAWAPNAELVLVHAIDAADPRQFLKERIPGERSSRPSRASTIR